MLCTCSANPLSSQSFFHDLCLEVSLIRIWNITFRHVGLLYRIVIYNYNNSNFRRSKGHLDVKGQILQHAVRIQILSICSLPDKLSFQTFFHIQNYKALHLIGALRGERSICKGLHQLSTFYLWHARFQL